MKLTRYVLSVLMLFIVGIPILGITMSRLSNNITVEEVRFKNRV